MFDFNVFVRYSAEARENERDVIVRLIEGKCPRSACLPGRSHTALPHTRFSPTRFLVSFAVLFTCRSVARVVFVAFIDFLLYFVHLSFSLVFFSFLFCQRRCPRWWNLAPPSTPNPLFFHAIVDVKTPHELTDRFLVTRPRHIIVAVPSKSLFANREVFLLVFFAY